MRREAAERAAALAAATKETEEAVIEREPTEEVQETPEPTETATVTKPKPKAPSRPS